MIKTLWAVSLLTLTCVLSFAGLSAHAESVKAGQHRALLIGINDYASPMVNDLRGAVNDVHMLQRVLVTRLGFAEENIQLLTDADATRAGILDALGEFIETTAPNDTVYIHFSGHGSQVEDSNGDENDQLDETILPHDARTSNIADITDDEIDRLLASLPTNNALVVFDSCHSGTITRSVSTVQPRAVARDNRHELYSNNIATREVVPVRKLGHVLMTGAPAEEQALDGPVDNGYYGLFSYSLAKAMDRHGPAASAEQVHYAVKEELRRIQEQLNFRPPEPQLEATRERIGQPLFGRAAPKLADEQAQGVQAFVPPAGSAARRAWLPVKRLGKARALLVNGIALNARPGSRWAIYPPGETRFANGRALATGRVAGIKQRDAVLKLDQPGAPLPKGARAIAIAPPNPSADLTISLHDVPGNRDRQLAKLVKAQLLQAKFVRPGQFARLQIRFERGRWLVFGAGGLQELEVIPDQADKALASQIARLAARSSTSMALLALDNPSSDIQLQVGVQTKPGDKVAARGLVKVTDSMRPVYRMRQPGEPRSHANSLTIEVQADRPVYLNIVSVDTEGGVTVLFPNGYQQPDFYPQGRIPANQLVRIPDKLETGNLAGFHWDYGPPAGRDTLRVFASEDLAMAKRFHKMLSAAARDRSVFRSLEDGLADIHTRGVRVVADEGPQQNTLAIGSVSDSQTDTDIFGDWTARSLVLEIRP